MVAATFQPFSAKYIEVSLPIPVDAPVIKIVFVMRLFKSKGVNSTDTI
jgi:hypothetical protein